MQKNDLEKQFEFLVDKITKLERDISELNAGINRLEEKIDDAFFSLKNSQTDIDDISSTALEIKNNMRAYNQSERQFLIDMSTKLAQELRTLFGETHYLQYKLQKTQQSAESNEKSLADIKSFVNVINTDRLTKDDLRVVESFLRLIAANQMIQETYFET